MARNVKEMNIPVILGPTSSGKTGLAVELCQKLGGEIISADSRQVYKHMDIGTGKTPLQNSTRIEKSTGFWKIEGIKVWGYDIVSPGEYFSAYDFALFGLDKARKILECERTPFLVGGTGLYIDFFTGEIKGNSLPPDFDYRNRLENKTLSELQKMATSLNLEINESDFSNKRRLIRIIERNTPREEKSSTPLPYLKDAHFIYIGLTAPRDILYSRADAWVDSIWQQGQLSKEIQNLILMGFADTPQLNGFIYKEGLKFIENQTSMKEAIQRIKFDVHAYIRRQQTYFKKNTKIRWFDISQDNWKQNIYNYLKDAGY